MRTTITISDDVAAEMKRLQREQGIGPSEALNALARKGMAAGNVPVKPYRHRSASVGLRVDVTDIGAVLDLLDDESS